MPESDGQPITRLANARRLLAMLALLERSSTEEEEAEVIDSVGINDRVAGLLDVCKHATLIIEKYAPDQVGALTSMVVDELGTLKNHYLYQGLRDGGDRAVMIARAVTETMRERRQDVDVAAWFDDEDELPTALASLFLVTIALIRALGGIFGKSYSQTIADLDRRLKLLDERAA